MTPQEKLAARLELVAKRLDPDGPSVRDTPGLNSFAEITAEVRAIATALSEQGEVTTTTDASGRCVAVTRQDGEGRILSTIWEASEHGKEEEPFGWVCEGDFITDKAEADEAREAGATVTTVYTTPPTPSAPDRMAIKLLVTAGFITEAKANEALNIAHGFSKGSLSPPSAPAEYMRHPSGDGTIVRKDDPSRRLSVDEILAAMHGPSAPVVDDAIQDACDDILHKLEGWAEAYPECAFGPVTDAERKEHGSLISRASASMGRHIARVIKGDIAKLRAALSGVSAPVGVEAERLADALVSAPYRDTTIGNMICAEVAWENLRPAVVAALKATLTPPAAAPRVEGYITPSGERCRCDCHRNPNVKHIAPCCYPAATPAASEDVPSRSRLRRIAAEKGEPAPRFDGGEDGLPEEIEAIVCPLEDDAAAMLERLPDDGTAHTMQAAAALIRRLAASGQGVEWRPIETAPKDGTEILACNDEVTLVTRWFGGGLTWYYRSDDYSVDDWSPTHWMPLPAAPTQEKANG